MSMFLKFIGPMRTLSQRGVKFEKGKIYRVDNEERALDMVESGRFQQVRDPTLKREASKDQRRFSGVRINRRPEQSERGDLSQDDLLNRSDTPSEGDDGEEQPREVSENPVEFNEEDDGRPKLPAQQFTSKGKLIEWAKQNLDLELDKNRSLPELNRTLVTEYGRRYKKTEEAEDGDDDDTKDENTKVEAIIVA